MSGIEAIGLVLAFWPVLSDAIKVIRSARSMEELQDEVLICSWRFEHVICSLLDGDDEIEPQQLLLLCGTGGSMASADIVQLWKDDKICGGICARLGPDKVDMISRYVKKVEDGLRKVEQGIRAGDVGQVRRHMSWLGAWSLLPDI
jgi:hypothetical protein